MVASMTGFGRAEVSRDGININVEVRSVNSRYLDLTLRLPRNFSQREKELKDIVRKYLNRGNLNITVKIAHDANGAIPLKVNKAAAKSYFKLLNDIRKSVKIREQVGLEHLLTFSEVFEPIEEKETDELEWKLVEETVQSGIGKSQCHACSRRKRIGKGSGKPHSLDGKYFK